MTTDNAPRFHAPIIRTKPTADAHAFDVEEVRLRVYGGGGFIRADFRQVKSGLVVVSPIRPPEKTGGGLAIPGTATDIPGQLCVLHKVEAAGETPPGSLPVKPGDIVVCMLAFLDPLDEKGNLCDILADKIVNIIGHVDEPAAEAVPG